LATALVFGASACSGGTGLVGTPPAATVDGTTITQDEVVEATEATRRFYEYSIEAGQDQSGQLEDLVERITGSGASTIGAEPAAQVLTELILDEVLRQELEARDALPSEEDIAAVRSEAAEQLGGEAELEKLPQGYLDRIIESEAMSRAFAQDEVAAIDAAVEPLTPEERDEQMRALFEQANATSPFCFQVIETPEEATATAARARVDAGDDFVAVSRDVAPEGTEIPDGGVVGCLGLEQAAQLFQQDVSGSQVGDVIGPVEATLQEGAAPIYLVVKVSSLEGQSYQEMLPRLEQQVPAQPTPTDPSTFDSTAARAEVLAAADIEVNPMFGTWRPMLGAVEPPRAPASPTSVAAEPVATVPGS
jgi:hypothetical protein